MRNGNRRKWLHDRRCFRSTAPYRKACCPKHSAYRSQIAGCCNRFRNQPVCVNSVRCRLVDCGVIISAQYHRNITRTTLPKEVGGGGTRVPRYALHEGFSVKATHGVAATSS